MNKKHWMVAAGLALGLATTTVFAGVGHEFGPNLVVNGGFENTSTVAGSGWTVSGAYTSEGYDYFIDTLAADARSGTHSFAGGAVGALGFLSQTLATRAGQQYDIHLSLANLSGFADNTAVQVSWNGQVVYSATDILGFGYADIVIDPLATGSSTVLSIGLQDNDFFLNLDNVSVLAVPEPATVALVFAGLGAIGSLRARRRKAPRA